MWGDGAVLNWAWAACNRVHSYVLAICFTNVVTSEELNPNDSGPGWGRDRITIKWVTSLWLQTPNSFEIERSRSRCGFRSPYTLRVEFVKQYRCSERSKTNDTLPSPVPFLGTWKLTECESSRSDLPYPTAGIAIFAPEEDGIHTGERIGDTLGFPMTENTTILDIVDDTIMAIEILGDGDSATRLIAALPEPDSAE
jgi:hypothetical protein